jgi:hypothetical protein
LNTKQRKKKALDIWIRKNIRATDIALRDRLAAQIVQSWRPVRCRLCNKRVPVTAADWCQICADEWQSRVPKQQTSKPLARPPACNSRPLVAPCYRVWRTQVSSPSQVEGSFHGPAWTQGCAGPLFRQRLGAYQPRHKEHQFTSDPSPSGRGSIACCRGVPK